MGRRSRYETHVKPYLHDIQTWYEDLDERQIATQKLGIAISTWEKYKTEHPELREALKKGKQNLISELKASLKKKAKGYYYKEKRSYVKDEGGKKTKILEETEKYAQPDTGAIHLLLKNLDPEWKNDDQATIDMKKKQLDLTERKIEQNEW